MTASDTLCEVRLHVTGFAIAPAGPWDALATPQLPPRRLQTISSWLEAAVCGCLVGLQWSSDRHHSFQGAMALCEVLLLIIQVGADHPWILGEAGGYQGGASYWQNALEGRRVACNA